MWAEKLPNGKYKYRERYTDAAGKSHIVSVTMDKNTKQAEKMAREMLRQKMSTPAPSSITLEEVCDMYLSDQKPILKASTWSRNSYALITIKSILGPDTKPESMTAGYIRQKMLASGKSAGTLNELMIRFKTVMRWAYANDVLTDIRSIDKIERFRDLSRAEKVQDKFLESWELSALLDAMTDPVWHDLTLFLALTGLRIGEASALTRSDIDLDNREIYVTKTYDANNDVVTTPKTFRSERSVYVQDELLPLVTRLMAQNQVLSISNLFFTKNGKRISYDNYRIYLRKKSIKVLGRPVTPHVLRHTHASLLMEQGVDIETISARLGHEDSRVTREIYTHVTLKLTEKRNEELRKIKLVAP